MSDFKLSAKSQSKLKGVHPDLVRVVNLAIELTETDFTVVEGVRSLKRQQELIKVGKSKLKDARNGKHVIRSDGYGHAVDIYPYVSGTPITEWGEPWPGKYWLDVSNSMKHAAKQLGVRIQWGGDWEEFRDGPHYELV